MKLLGFGKGKTKTVHVIVDSNKPLCQANIKKSKTKIPPEKYQIKDVSCKKCMRLKFYKDLLQSDSFLDIVPIEKEPKSKCQCNNSCKKTADNKIAIKSLLKYISKLRAKKTRLLKIINSQNKKIIHGNIQNQEKIKAIEQKILSIGKENNTFLNNIIEGIQGQFHCKQRVDFTYRIYHTPSKQIMFDKIGQDLIIQAITILNNLSVEWNGKGSMPPHFIPALKKAMKCAFTISGQNYPICLNDIVKNQKPAPEKITIARKKITIKRKAK